MMKALGFFVLTLSLSIGAQAGVIFSENFETAVTGTYSTAGGVITGTTFSLVSGSIDIVGGASYGWLCAAPASSICLDTTGSTASFPGRGVVGTTSLLSLSAGTDVLSFSLVRWNDTQLGGG